MIRSALIAAVAAGCFFAGQAQACDSYVAHIGSYHTDRDLIVDVNETNPGVGCRVGQAEVGVYKNSYSDLTAYAVYDTTLEGFGLFAGVASGYQDDAAVADHGITPVFGAVFHTENTTTRVMPTYSQFKGDAGLVMSFSLKFGG